MFGIDDFSAEELRRIRKKVDTLRGDGVTNHPDYIVISQPQRKTQPPSSVESRQLVKITNQLPGKGCYNCVVLDPPTVDITGNSNLTASLLGAEITMTPTPIFLQLPEAGKTYSDLQSGQLADARLLRINTDGTHVYVGVAFRDATCET